MKTKEVIRQLMEADPSGEQEVCVENCDIHFIDAEPAYYDGCLQVLVRDPNTQYYNVVGAKYVRHGTKIVIHTLSISDAIFNDKTMPVTFDGNCPITEQRYMEFVARHRQETEEIENSVESGFFIGYMKKRLLNFSEDFSAEEIESAAKTFFQESMTRDDPMPEDLQKEWGMSWVDRRHKQWDREIEVSFDNGKLTLKGVKCTS